MKKKIIAIIPARSGSRGLRNKNIKLLGGHPLLAWSIAVCKKTKLIDYVLVSTNSTKYAKIAKKYKIKVVEDACMGIGAKIFNKSPGESKIKQLFSLQIKQ